MRLSDFRVKTDFWPLVSPNDELVINFRDAISSAYVPVVYIGCHEDAQVYVRSAQNRNILETATPWTNFAMAAGTKKKLDLTDGNFLDCVSKITTTSGSIFVGICAFGEFDAYFKQVQVANT